MILTCEYVTLGLTKSSPCFVSAMGTYRSIEAQVGRRGGHSTRLYQTHPATAPPGPQIR